jgi:hypothetical protein
MVQQLILKHVIGQVVELLLSQDLVLTTVASCTAGDRLASDGPVGIIDAIRAASAQNRHAWPSTSTHRQVSHVGFRASAPQYQFHPRRH